MYLKHAPLFRIPVKPRPTPEKDPLQTLAKTARKDPWLLVKFISNIWKSSVNFTTSYILFRYVFRAGQVENLWLAVSVVLHVSLPKDMF